MHCITKRIVSIVLSMTLILGISTGALGATQKAKAIKAPSEMKGMWLSFIDQQEYLKGKTRADYDKAFENICKTAASKGVNTIFVHVRSHNDAIYPSKIYPWSSVMLDGTDPGFDPLSDMVDIAHRNGLKIHAWLNPYGFRNGAICGDATLSTNENIILGVKEILDGYAVDGIHFDDYFPPVGKDTINAMVYEVHSACMERGRLFGIAPQGNIDNCLAAGADVKTWLSETGYIDYIAPQIYWTDNYGKTVTQKMSSNRLKAWKDLNTAGIPMYVGMALYRAGSASASDPGWMLATDNLAKQMNIATGYGYTGFILYNTASVMKPNTAQEQELSNLMQNY